MLIFPLKKEWYEKIRRGEKNIEYRTATQYWNRRIHNAVMAEFGRINNMEVHLPLEASMAMLQNVDPVWFEPSDNITLPCILRCGYGLRQMAATITKIEYLESGIDTDLHTVKPVYAIHLADIKEGVCL